MLARPIGLVAICKEVLYMEYIYTLCVGKCMWIRGNVLSFSFFLIFMSQKVAISCRKKHVLHTQNICCSKFFFGLQYFAPYDTSLRTQFELILGIEVFKTFSQVSSMTRVCLSLCVSLPFRMALKFILELFGSFQVCLVHHLCTHPSPIIMKWIIEYQR
jgi:hypothetical protein